MSSRINLTLLIGILSVQLFGQSYTYPEPYSKWQQRYNYFLYEKLHNVDNAYYTNTSNHTMGLFRSAAKDNKTHRLISDAPVIESLNNMYRKTGDITYLETAVKHIELILSKKVKVDADSYPDVWPIETNLCLQNLDPQILPYYSPYDVGIIGGALADFTYMILNETPALVQNTTYGTHAFSNLAYPPTAPVLENKTYKNIAIEILDHLDNAFRVLGNAYTFDTYTYQSKVHGRYIWTYNHFEVQNGVCNTSNNYGVCSSEPVPLNYSCLIGKAHLLTARSFGALPASTSFNNGTAASLENVYVDLATKAAHNVRLNVVGVSNNLGTTSSGIYRWYYQDVIDHNGNIRSGYKRAFPHHSIPTNTGYCESGETGTFSIEDMSHATYDVEFMYQCYDKQLTHNGGLIFDLGDMQYLAKTFLWNFDEENLEFSHSLDGPSAHGNWGDAFDMTYWLRTGVANPSIYNLGAKIYQNRINEMSYASWVSDKHLLGMSLCYLNQNVLDNLDAQVLRSTQNSGHPNTNTNQPEFLTAGTDINIDPDNTDELVFLHNNQATGQSIAMIAGITDYYTPNTCCNIANANAAQIDKELVYYHHDHASTLIRLYSDQTKISRIKSITGNAIYDDLLVLEENAIAVDLYRFDPAALEYNFHSSIPITTSGSTVLHPVGEWRGMRTGNIKPFGLDELVLIDQKDAYVFSYNGTTFDLMAKTNNGSGSYWFGPAVGDFDADGTDEIAIARDPQNLLVIYEYVNTPNLNSIATKYFTGNMLFNQMAAGDFDQDKKADLVLSVESDQDLYFYTLNTSGGTAPYPVNQLPDGREQYYHYKPNFLIAANLYRPNDINSNGDLSNCFRDEVLVNESEPGSSNHLHYVHAYQTNFTATGTCIEGIGCDPCHEYESIAKDPESPEEPRERKTNFIAQPNMELEFAVIQVYPNPSNGPVTVQLANDQPTSIVVFNTAGKKVKQFTATQQKVQLDFNKQPKGIYVIQITNNEHVVQKRVIIR